MFNLTARLSKDQHCDRCRNPTLKKPLNTMIIKGKNINALLHDIQRGLSSPYLLQIYPNKINIKITIQRYLSHAQIAIAPG